MLQNPDLIHENVFYNGRCMPAAGALIRTVTSAGLYGKGIFSTIAVRNKESFLWDKHWRRLKDDAQRLSIDLSQYSEERVTQAVAEIIEANSVTNARMRLTFFDGSSAGRVWLSDSKGSTEMLIITADARPVSHSLRLAVSPHRINSTSPLAGTKSCNYLEHLMAFEEAKKRDFNEAVRLNERGEVTSACMANLFWLKDRQLLTPSLKTGCLPGTTREYVLETLDCLEVEASIAELNSADDIFLTSAGIGVIQVAEFDGRPMRNEPHKMLEIVPKPI